MVTPRPARQGTVADLVNGLLDRNYNQVVAPVLNAIGRQMNSGLVQQRLDELEAEVQRLRDEGQRLQPDNPVLRALTADLEIELRAAARLADSAAEPLQGTAIQAAGTIQRQLALPGVTDAQLARLGATWNRPDPEAVARLVGYAGSDAWAATLQKYGDDILSIVNNQAIRGVALGWGPVRTATSIRQTVENLPQHQANNLMRTLQLTAYRDATAAHQQANLHIASQIIRVAALDQRTCLTCVALHGTVLWDSEVDANAPIPRVNDHHSGRCLLPGQAVVTSGGVKLVEDISVGDYVLTHKGRYRRVTATYSRQYAGEIIRIGNLAVTPEHPVMTQRGWVEARDLRASDIFWMLNSSLVRGSIRSTSQPCLARMRSFLASCGRFLFDRCQRGSYSTANFSASNAKSILYRSTASCGAGNKPASCSASRNSDSPGLRRFRQFRWRVLALFRNTASVDPACCNRSIISGSLSIWRRTASFPSIGSIPHCLSNFIRERVLMPISAVNSRYVACSSTYLRLRYEAMGSPSLAASSLRQSSLRRLPPSVTSKPNFWRRRWIAVFDRPSIRSAISFAYKPRAVSTFKSESSAGVQGLPATSFSFQSIMTIVHQPEYSGKVYDLTVEEDHSFIANGIAVHNCTSVVIVKGRPRTIQTGQDWWDSLPPERQAQQASLANSPGKLDALRSGQAALRDFVQPYTDPTFGPMLREASLTGALANQA